MRVCVCFYVYMSDLLLTAKSVVFVTDTDGDIHAELVILFPDCQLCFAIVNGKCTKQSFG